MFVFPTTLDSLTDNTSTTIAAAHINSLQTKVGIDSSAVTTSHDYKLSGVTGSDKAAPNSSPTFTGDVYMSNTRTIGLTRTIPTTVNDEVDLGAFSITNGGATFQISIAVPSGGFSVSKMYLIAAGYNETNNVWQTVAPLSSTGPYIGVDYDLEININNTTVSFRIRKTATATAGTAYVFIHFQGITSDTWTPSTSTSSIAAPTVFYGGGLLTQADGSVGIGITAPSSKAILDLTSVTQGFLPPRMSTAQRDAITGLPDGLVIFNVTTHKLNVNENGTWRVVTTT